MTSELFAPVVSIVTTKRKRFFWAAWWSGAPARVPFRKPDASDGGAETVEAAIAAAAKRAELTLTVTDPLWARAWMRILRGQDPFPSKASRQPRVQKPVESPVDTGSIWALLGIPRSSTVAEVKAAYRKRAIELHPDHGGDPETFRRLLEAYGEATRRAAKPRSAR